jgi:hypothetical protein
LKGIELQNYRCGFDDSQALPCFKFYVSLELVAIWIWLKKKISLKVFEAAATECTNSALELVSI